MQNVEKPQAGCYVGVSKVDYENNVACYPVNAYTATGTLKSFVAGKAAITLVGLLRLSQLILLARPLPWRSTEHARVFFQVTAPRRLPGVSASWLARCGTRTWLERHSSARLVHVNRLMPGQMDTVVEMGAVLSF